MFASTLGVMLAMGIILTVLISMTIGYIATVGSTPDYTPKKQYGIQDQARRDASG